MDLDEMARVLVSGEGGGGGYQWSGLKCVIGCWTLALGDMWRERSWGALGTREELVTR